MKKLVLAMVVLSLCWTGGFASPSDMFQLSDSVHEKLSTLYVSQGLAIPSSALPYTRAELDHHLSRLDPEELSWMETKLYTSLVGESTMELPAFSIESEISFETYIHSNTEDFIREEDWVYSYLDRKSLVSVPMTLSLGAFSGVFDLTLGSSNIDGKEAGTMDEGTSELYGKKNLTTNLPYDFSLQTLSLDANVPYRAFLSTGGSNWVVQVGRDRISWGPGFSGNFMIGEQLQYHNMARLAVYQDSFKYSFITSFFPHPNEIYDSSLPDSQARPITGLKMFMAHRFEWRLFSDRVNLVLSEGIMYQDGGGDLDLRIVNPMMLYHNYYLRSQANSLATLELDYTFKKGWNIYTQFAVDELAFGPDEWELAREDRHPNGLAFMLGLRMEKPLEEGVLSGHLEGVYTDPYFYLRSIDGNASQIGEMDSLNYVVALRKWYSDDIVYDQTYLGYQYGGDAIVLHSALSYEVPDDWYLKGRLFAMVHGSVEKNTLWELGEIDPTPTGSPTFYTQIGMEAGKSLKGWKVYSSLNFLTKTKEYSYYYDLQFTLGATYTWH